MSNKVRYGVVAAIVVAAAAGIWALGPETCKGGDICTSNLLYDLLIATAAVLASWAFLRLTEAHR